MTPPVSAESAPPIVAVIGAGIAGLACARTLGDAGLRVRVFDKGRGPGGRAGTRWHPPLQFDHGAQYFTAHDPRFAERLPEWLAAGAIAPWTGGAASQGPGSLEAMAEPRVVNLDGASGEITPAPTPDSPWYVGVPGMGSLAAHLARGLSVRTGTTVWRISRDGPRWRLFEKAGAELGPGEVVDRRSAASRSAPYAAVAVACPAPQAATLLAPFPALAGAAAGVEMLPCWSVMLAFRERLDVPFDAAFVSGSPLQWIARDSSKPGRAAAGAERDCWVLHAGHEWSAEHLEDAQEAVAVALTEALHGAVRRELPASEFTQAHRWRHARPRRAIRETCLLSASGDLGIAGDWFDPNGDGGRVEAAYLSGLALGERMAARLS